MAHKEQFAFLQRCKTRFPESFGPNIVAVEIGSQNINGTARDLFAAGAKYFGVDIGPGPVGPKFLNVIQCACADDGILG